MGKQVLEKCLAKKLQPEPQTIDSTNSSMINCF